MPEVQQDGVGDVPRGSCNPTSRSLQLKHQASWRKQRLVDALGTRRAAVQTERLAPARHYGPCSNSESRRRRASVHAFIFKY